MSEFQTITFSFGDDDGEDFTDPTGPLDPYADRDWDFRPNLRQIRDWLIHLDNSQILQTIRLKSSMQVRCPACHTENFGQVLDESKILLPFPAGAFHGRTDLVHHVYPGNFGSIVTSRTGPHVVTPGPFGTEPLPTGRYLSHTPYELKMDIVRSGLFTEEQLRGANGQYNRWLSRHEIEVSATAFKLVRPVTCITCRNIPLSGLSPHWGVLYNRAAHDFPARLGELPRLHTVDDLHVAGEGIRTGFRIRSRSARLRRRYRSVKKQTIYCLHGDCLLDRSLAIPVVLLYTPPRRSYPEKLSDWARNKARRYRRTHISYRGRYVATRPMGHHRKYWYFLRKRGTFYVSKHHPYGDEFNYFLSSNSSMEDSSGSCLSHLQPMK